MIANDRNIGLLDYNAFKLFVAGKTV